MKRPPAASTSRLRRHPVLLARWLACRARIQRVTWLQTASAGAALVAVTAILVAIAMTFRDAMHAFLVAVHDQWLLPFAVGGIHAVTLVSRRKRMAAAVWPQHWLGAAPIHAGSLRLSRGIHALWPVAAQLALAVAVFLLFASVAGTLREALLPLAALGSGTITGSAAGLSMPATRQRERHEASRYTFTRPGQAPDWRASTRGLSLWPIARAISAGRPENARVLFLFVALFAVQSGASALQGIAIMSIWLLVGYLASLLAALVAVSQAASCWLRPTSIDFVTFGWSLAKRALLHQVGGTLLAVALIAAGESLATALYLGAMWLTAVVTVSSIALSLNYRALQPTTRIAVSVVTLAAIEARHVFWSIPAAALLVAWHARQGARR